MTFPFPRGDISYDTSQIPVVYIGKSDSKGVMYEGKMMKGINEEHKQELTDKGFNLLVEQSPMSPRIAPT